MLPVFMKLAESRFQKISKGWTYTPIGTRTPGHVTDAEAYAQIRHAHGTFIFMVGIECVAAVFLLFFASYVTMKDGNPLADMGLPFQLIALVPITGLPLLYIFYRMRIKKWLTLLPGNSPSVK